MKRNPQSFSLQREAEAQRTIWARAWQDTQVRQDLAVAVGGGLLSSIALARAYARLTAVEGKADSGGAMLRAAALALLTGSVSIVWKMRQAAKVGGGA